MMIGPLVISSLVLLPFAVFFITLGLRGWWIFNTFGLLNWSKLHRTGVRVDGYITSHSIRTTTYHRKPANSFYYITYRYEYAGKTYTRKQGVSKRHYQDWADGHIAPVYCLPGTPEMAILSEDRLELQSSLFLIALGVFALLMWILGVVLISHLAR